MAKASLTIKQEKFCNKYLECGNASEAYRYAYDCSKMSDNSVWCNASQLLADTKVAQRLEYLKSHLAEASGITALQIIREHQKIAFSDATRIRNGWMSLKEFESLTDDEKACIRSVETKQTKRTTPMGDEVIDEQVKITCYDKQKALDSIVSMLGYNAPEKIANTDSKGNDIPQPTFNVERLFQLIQEGKNNE
ncbi:MAG: terminase small subunit [Alistipes ihumii]|jgi:phage terminase small subunit|uniref:terminase small subunit n=1 Tax=Alistipes ihumii TaxID=1470347 RepID=UPI00399BD250